MKPRRPAIVFSLMGLRNAEAIAEAILHRWDVDLLTWEPASSLLSLRGIPHQPLLDLAPQDDTAITEAIARVHRASEALQDPAFRRAYAHIHDPQWDQLMRALNHALRNDVYVGVVIAETVRAATERYDIRLAVVSEDHMRDNRALVNFAGQRGVPTLQVIHSVPTGSRMPLEPVSTEHVAVFSDYTRDQYVALGAPADRTVITGNPAWDPFVRPPLPGHKAAVCASMGLDPKRPIVNYAITAGADLTATFAAYPRHHLDLAEAVVHAFVQLSREHPEWQFLLRPRPGPHDADDFVDMLAAMPPDDVRAITIDRNSPYNSVVVSDVLLCTQSNMGVEAIMMGKPAINVDIEAFGSAIYREGLGPLFDERDAVLHARSSAEIVTAVEAAMLDEATRLELRARRAYSLQKFNGACDGHATARVVDLILRLARARDNAPHPFYATELALRTSAQEHNEAGEKAFNRGDVTEAVAQFTKAVSLHRSDARILNNLATAALTCGDTARAWNLIQESFHFDPISESVRQNLLAIGEKAAPERARKLLALFGQRGV